MAECFVSRHPILDASLDLFAYELQYHSGPKHTSAISSQAETARLILNTYIDIGLENLVGNNPAFMGLSREFFTAADLIHFPPEQVVLEVTKNTKIDPELIQSLRRLTENGYRIALDNFISHYNLTPIVELSDYIKIDSRALDHAEVKQHIALLKPYGAKLLVQNIINTDELDFYRDLGAHLFQGGFISKPEITSSKQLPTNHLNVLQLLAKLNNPDTDIDELEALISIDVPLSVKTLKCVNSPISGLRRTVDSVRQAIIYLGRETIKNWVALLALAKIEGRSPELTTTVLVRARLCQLLAKAAHLQADESFFTVGLLSALDTMMGAPMSEILEQLPLTPDVKAALLKQEGPKGEAIHCAIALERGNPSGLKFATLEWRTIADQYLPAMRWADESSQLFKAA